MVLNLCLSHKTENLMKAIDSVSRKMHTNTCMQSNNKSKLNKLWSAVCNKYIRGMVFLKSSALLDHLLITLQVSFLGKNDHCTRHVGPVASHATL